VSIPEEAVEAAARAMYAQDGGVGEFNLGVYEDYAAAMLEAAAPYMLSHEREQTRLAHIDAMVNRETKHAELAEVWYEGFRACNSKHIYDRVGGVEPDISNPYAK
jgi:hypothetical protein